MFHTSDNLASPVPVSWLGKRVMGRSVFEISDDDCILFHIIATAFRVFISIIVSVKIHGGRLRLKGLLGTRYKT